MSTALDSSLGIVAYLALFSAIGLVFLFANLLVGRFLRPHDPHQEKLEIYECGEPTIGSSFVQFDLRFYVVALLFIIFDVEVAFFFPWATVFGKSMHLADPAIEVVQATDGAPAAPKLAEEVAQFSSTVRGLYRELGVTDPELPRSVPASLAVAGERELDVERVVRAGGRQLALLTIVDIVVFFAILLVGFAYVWRRGDLDWVRAVSRERSRPSATGVVAEDESAVLSA